MKRLHKNRVYFFCFALFGLILTGCEKSLLEKIEERGEIVFITRNAPTTYYQGREGPAGFEHDHVLAFAREMGIKHALI